MLIDVLLLSHCTCGAPLALVFPPGSRPPEVQRSQLNYSHLKWEFVWEPLEAVRVISYLSNRSSKRLSSFS